MSSILRPALIGFGHKRERGKDTCCDFIVKEFSKYEFQKDAFAYSLKEGIGKGVFGLTDGQLYTDLKREVDPFWKMTPREILQKAGTDAMRRQFGKDIWVNTMMRRFYTSNKHTVVSDIRFLNEAEAIKSEGGYLIKLTREVAFDPQMDLHRSETDLDSYNGWDYIINNNGPKEELYSQLSKIVIKILQERDEL